MPSLSPRSLETLIDLVEIKLSCLEIIDRTDRREQFALKQSLAELQACRKARINLPRRTAACVQQASL